MSGFNTKERNNNGEFEITFYTENRQDFKKVQDLCRELIGHGTPISTEGDLISRSELKKALCETKDIFVVACLSRVLEVIDNAPTVPTVEERPQGEWEEPFENNGKTYHKCNRCHISSELILIDRFCPSCGAYMWKGGTE